MRRFVQRALNKLGKLDHIQLHAFIQDLARENEKLEVLIDSLTDGLIVCDKTNVLMFLNKAAERLLPIDVSNLSERIPVWEHLGHKGIGRFVRGALLDPGTSDEEEFIIDHNHTNRILCLQVGPLVSKGRIQGSIIRISDVSEKRMRDMRLKRAESLAKLSTVAAGVAHEIKNPLGAISIHIQLIQRLLASQPCSYPSDVNSYLDVVTDEIDRLNRIVVDFLFAVRPMDIQLIRSSLSDLVEEVLQFMKPELLESSINLVSECPPNMPDVLLDSKYIKQALLNLFKNAVHAMPEGGTLTVRGRLEGSLVCLDISDTGVGMAPEILEKIFEPFFTTKDFGSGIGLTLVYKIVREHGGEVNVQSKPGSGSKFTLSFPAHSEGSHRLLSAPAVQFSVSEDNT